MSDSRYPAQGHIPQPQYASNQQYATSNIPTGYPHRSQRPATPYVPGQPSYPTSYPANQFAVPQRSMTPSLAGHPQSGYPQGVSRHRTQSTSTIPANAAGHYGNSQNSSMLGHHRTHSQLPTTSQFDPGYMTAHSHVPPADYVQPSSTLAPSTPADYYYAQASNAQEGQFSASTQRPFPCDMCALSFNRQHDLKRHRDTHSGERPFLCNGGCGKTFTRKDALKRHQLVKSCGRAED